MKTIKRYNVAVNETEGTGLVDHIENKTGAWVFYEDVKHLIIKEEMENVQPLIKGRFKVCSAYTNSITDVSELRFDTLEQAFYYLNKLDYEEITDRIVKDLHEDMFVDAYDVVEMFRDGESPEDLDFF